MSRASLSQALIGVLILAVTLGTVSAANARGTTGSSTAAITGTINSIDVAKKNVTIKTSTGTSVKVSVGRKTAITRNGASTSLANLSLNDSVTAQYKVMTLSAITLTATGAATTTVSGRTSNVSLGNGALSVGSNQLQTNANTRIARNGLIVSLRQITVLDTLVVHVATGTTVALDILADGPEEGEVQGTISGIVGSNVTITPDNGSPAITIVVGTTTLIEVNDASGTLADLAVGQAIDAEYDPTTLIAFSISADSESEDGEIQGTVASVDTVAGTVTITPQGGGANVTLTVNSATEVQVNGEGGALGDIQVGMPITAEYDTTTLVASQIEAGGSDD